jgi:ATP-dependent helicase/nuclease subunit A
MVRRRCGGTERHVKQELHIPDDVLAIQRAASDPSTSAWVEANAGSGKTYVLAQRVIRLMLCGVDPTKILCLTFTRAAAANMANQVSSILSSWVALDDVGLHAEMARIEGRRCSVIDAVRARRLFAAALETPGGLKVQTIHGFCTRLLQQFPFEADVAARFTVLEEAAQRELLDRLTLGVLLDAASEPERPLGKAFSTAMLVTSDRGLSLAIEEMIGKRHVMIAWMKRAGGLGPALEELSRALGVEPSETLQEIERMVTQGFVPASEWGSLASTLAEGSPSDRERSADLLAGMGSIGAAQRRAYLAVFFTAEGERRRNIVTKGFARRYPELTGRLEAEQERLVELTAKRRAAAARDRTAALLVLAHAVVGRYIEEKERRGLLDYDDLIEKTAALLTNVEASWVHYKLDLGIDHVLIDEAQDTSPRQWNIIRSLVEEFTAGAGARDDRPRTVFAVGDEKQSIFSFQGAAPDQLGEVEQTLASKHRAVELDFERCTFSFSFRSGANILAAVDRVFADASIAASITSDPAGVPPHSALPGKAPGVVEIWPLIEPQSRTEIEPWNAPFDEPHPSSPQALLAGRVAGSIRILVDRGRSPGDVLVLVRQRGPLFEALIKSIKEAGVAVAGADRLVLTEHIAVMDLLALADALLYPADDLALAAVLKSPIFALDDEQLFEIAWKRRGTLRSALKQAARYTAVNAELDRLAELARTSTPFDFYAGLLAAEGVRARMLARLGTEAVDALDEFLALCLEYERQETPSLQGLLRFVRAARAEVKRDMDIGRDEVRVMTVHGAKGLEAPIVILADTTTRPCGPRDPRILTVPVPGAPGGIAECPVWAAAAKEDCPALSAARQRVRRAAEDEYRRLLYVGMTRAAEYLIVCGAKSLNGKPADCWYDLVWNALAPEAAEEPALDGQGSVRRWRRWPAASSEPDLATRAAAEPVPVPEWLHRHVAQSRDVISVRPSGAAGPMTGSRYSDKLRERAEALARGSLVHRLLQFLPDAPVERRADVARRYLASCSPQLGRDEHVSLIEQASRVLSESSFAHLFGPGSRAEVAIQGRLGGAGHSLRISGQVDRLAVTESTVFVADYKSDRPAPSRLDEVPPHYLRQLALYRGVLGKIYPGRSIRAALVWTETGTLMELPAAALDEALAAALAGEDSMNAAAR